MTINNGYQMRAWYDIIGIDRRSAEDFEGIKASAAGNRRADQDRERARHSRRRASRIAGFSQGGAMALHIGTRHPEKLAGVIALSCYLPLARELADGAHPANQATPSSWRMARRIPWCPTRWATIRGACSKPSGYTVEWHAYPMPHSVCEPEVRDVRTFLKKLF